MTRRRPAATLYCSSILRVSLFLLRVYASKKYTYVATHSSYIMWQDPDTVPPSSIPSSSRCDRAAIVAHLKLCPSLAEWPTDLLPIIGDYAFEPITWSTVHHRDSRLDDRNRGNL